MKSPGPPRFTLKPGRWVVLDQWHEGKQLTSPIRIEGVKPLGRGTGELELAFLEPWYSEGVQGKQYRLQALYRSAQELFAVRTDQVNGRCLRLGRLTREWLGRQKQVPALAALATAPSEDLDSQLDSLTRGAAGSQTANAWALPDEVTQTIMHCALRFDGWAWREAGGPERDQQFSRPVSDGMLRDLVLESDLEAAFGAFFFLQRFLFKWGGEMLPESDPHQTAYRFLFLHLYLQPTPAAWVDREQEADWQSIPGDRLAIHAGQVRRVLLHG